MKKLSLFLVITFMTIPLRAGYGDAFRVNFDKSLNRVEGGLNEDSPNKSLIQPAGECPICFDEQKPEILHPNLSALSHEAKKRGFEPTVHKNFVSICENKHVVCVPCFYKSVATTSCSICRGSLGDRRHISCLRCGAHENLEFAYCQSCKVVSVSCNQCRQLACCNQIKEPVRREDREAIKSHAKVLFDDWAKAVHEFQLKNGRPNLEKAREGQVLQEMLEKATGTTVRYTIRRQLFQV